MKNKLQLLLFFLICSFFKTHAQDYKKMIADGTYTLAEIQEAADKYFDKAGRGKGTGYKQYMRWEYFAVKQLDQNGYVKDPNYLFEELRSYNRQRNSRSSNQVLTNGASWSELGPDYHKQTTGWNPGVGRLSSFAVDQNDDDHIIVGSIGGGIWKTTDEGESWKPLTDNHGNMYTYSLAIDPKNSSVYYWGSSKGRIYKSINGGVTWDNVGKAGNYSVIKIVIHPEKTNILYACSQWNGLYKSVDGGNTWKQLIYDIIYDVEFDPNNTNTIIASGTRVFRSTDEGDNFTPIQGFSSGVKMIGVSKADSNIVYIVEARGRVFNALYRSEDNGISFKKLDHGTANYFGYHPKGLDKLGQAPRDMGITVSPTDPNEVHIAGINTWRSLDGGVTFTNTSQWVPQMAKQMGIGYCHADVDDLEFVGDDLYVVTDGGIFVCDDSKNLTANYYEDLTVGIGIRQFYLLGVSQTDPVVIVAGSQDNGSSIYRNVLKKDDDDDDDGDGDNDDDDDDDDKEYEGEWIDWLGADGFEGIVDVNDPKTIYGMIYNGHTYKTIDQGNTLADVKTEPELTYWSTPFEQDKHGTLYFGGRAVHKSLDGTATWQKISQKFMGLTNQVKVAPSDSKVIYASSYSRQGGMKLYKTTDGGVTQDWEELSGFEGYINSMAIHPKNPDKIAVTVTYSSKKVMISKDGGKTWNDYSNGLPNFSPYAIAWDDNNSDGLYVGMDYGIYYIDNRFQQWQVFNNNLPNVKVTELEINYADGYLYASTYGRGIWRSPRAHVMQPTYLEKEISDKIMIYPNPKIEDFINIKGKKVGKISVKLFNNKGQLVNEYKNVEVEAATFQISTSNLPQGVYFMRINDKKSVYTKKLILE